jgi:hypothetical protein
VIAYVDVVIDHGGYMVARRVPWEVCQHRRLRWRWDFGAWELIRGT